MSLNDHHPFAAPPEELFEPPGGEKIWRTSKRRLDPCKPLKFHKTAKEMFGNPWTKTR
jgi:hypothetical protein